MKKIEYQIDGIKHRMSIEGSPLIKYGNDEVLSREDTDITFHQPWYKDGYIETDFLSKEEFESLKNGLTYCIGKIIQEELSICIEGYDLVSYHQYVKNDSDHFKIVSKTRDLFAEDFNFPIMKLIPRLGRILGINLTDLNKKTNKKVHIIVRINRPNSNDFNPPHKDIYEGTDIEDSYIAPMANFWIPIVGVTNKSSLPLVPQSHLLNEKEILRTFDGGVVEGNKYRVRLIQSWNGKTTLIRSTVKDGQALIFSGHLIHGLAINCEADITRVALEFRLFKDDD